MNPGLTEEAGETARSMVEVFKSSPVVFAILMFNIVYMAFTAWAIHSGGERWERIANNAINACQPPKN